MNNSRDQKIFIIYIPGFSLVMVWDMILSIQLLVKCVHEIDPQLVKIYKTQSSVKFRSGYELSQNEGMISTENNLSFTHINSTGAEKGFLMSNID